MAFQQSPSCYKGGKSKGQSYSNKLKKYNTATNILSASFRAHAHFPLNNARWTAKAAKTISWATWRMS